jgi:hypothetical protein
VARRDNAEYLEFSEAMGGRFQCGGVTRLGSHVSAATVPSSRILSRYGHPDGGEPTPSKAEQPVGPRF